MPSPIGQSTSRWEKWNDALNPILLKEVRQLYKSRQFVLAFFLLLTAAWFVSVVALLAPEVILKFVPFGYGHTGQINGSALFFAIYAPLVVALCLIVPLRALESLAIEYDGQTMEMIQLTRIPADQIAIGKFWCSALHMGLYFASLGPFLITSYLLPGISFPSIIVLLFFAFVASLGLVSLALLLGSYSNSPTQRAILTIVLLVICVWVAWTWLSIVYGTLHSSFFRGGWEGLCCCFFPYIAVSTVCLATAIRRVRPRSPYIGRMQYIGPESLIRIANAVMEVTQAIREEFPVQYDEPPAKPQELSPFREAHSHVLKLTRRAERMMNRYSQPHEYVVAHSPLVPLKAAEEFTKLRKQFYALVTTYCWFGICNDAAYVADWPNRRQMPEVSGKRLEDIDSAARELIAVCETLIQETPLHYRSETRGGSIFEDYTGRL